VREAQAMIDRMVSVAGAEGITMRFDIIRSGNTFDAHRLLHFAHERGRQDALKERLFQAYFVEGQPIGDKDTNCRLAVDVGLDGKEARAVLGGDAFASEVRADEERARANGISGVPFFVFDQKYGLSGAQPPTTLLRFLEKTWSELPEQEETGAQEAMVCGPEGCA
jgi:predicted DsbA family dithiol-disulfide isomerase